MNLILAIALATADPTAEALHKSFADTDYSQAALIKNIEDRISTLEIELKNETGRTQKAELKKKLATAEKNLHRAKVEPPPSTIMMNTGNATPLLTFTPLAGRLPPGNVLAVIDDTTALIKTQTLIIAITDIDTKPLKKGQPFNSQDEWLTKQTKDLPEKHQPFLKKNATNFAATRIPAETVKAERAKYDALKTQ